MASRSRRIAPVVGLLLVGAYLLAGPGMGCMSFTAESILSSADFCFIFDCQNGILGGTIDPCSSAGSVLVAAGDERPLFTDCPQLTGP